ncbi:RICIN domain-containing protein, partial [Actinotalea ferrariae]|uniref:glycoside hydrolase n=1 Tax=Actinotalea ferrariae TaxID=1386098 RepID=UPI001C8C9EFD
ALAAEAPAPAAAGAAALAAPASGTGATAAAEPTPVTVTPNPGYRAAEPFEGWGTSLVWFAHATGGYPADVREELYQKVFGEDGLNLNIARYNVGGGNATDVDSEAYMRQGGDVPGWWQADLDGDGDTDEATLENAEAFRAAWDPEDDAAYDLAADPGQRWWVDRLVQDDRITHWEAFSNSPPWFMTESGYATGGFDPSTDQLRQDSIDDFAAYMTRVVEEIEDAHGIEVDTVNPMNEPNTNYWGTFLNPDGSLQCCRQEGAHMGPALQAQVIEALDARLDDPATTTDAVISAPDETNPGTFVTDWWGWTDEARAAAEQLNVHTYGTGDRVRARDIAKTSGKPLWMSEVEGDFSGVDGLDLTNIDNGLGMADRIVDDLRELEPDAWVFWQPVEDLWNMEITETANWGSVYIDFDCDAEGNSARRVAAGYPDPSCQVLTNAKYNTVRNFTHHIHPGDWSVPTDSEATTAFLRGDGTGATLVHVNQSDEAQQVTLDLSLFGQVDAGATVTPVVTTAPTSDDLEANALVEGTPVAVDAATRTATVLVPAKSVTTLLVDGVTGAADDAVPADDEGLLLEGVGSRLLLTADADGTTIEPLADDAAGATGQRWELHTLSGEGTNRRTVVLTDSTGGVLAAGPDHSVAVVASDLGTAAATPEQQWVLNTLDGRTWSLLNVATTEQLDVAGEGTAAGTGVGTWTSSTGAHQRWTVRSAQLQSVAPVQVATPVGVAPELPATVVPVYPWGEGTPVAVTWQVPDASSWAQPGAVTVTGTGADVFGTPFEATAVVDVGDHTLTDPVSVSTYVGADLASVVAQAPDVVPAHVGTSPRTYDLPVTWDWSTVDASATAAVGVVRVEGTATAPSGTLPASLAVVVTEPTPANAAPLPTTTASATFTEPGYDVDGTRNGDTTDKAWSNWRSGALRPSDTLTYDLGAPADVSAATVHFYRDGSHPSWARTVLAEYRATDGSWVAVPGGPQTVTVPQGGAPTAEIDLGGVRTDAVRFVLDPSLRDGAPVHMTVAEVEIDVLAASPSAVADLAALRVGGVPVPGFDPAQGEYTVQVPEGAGTDVTAIALDRQATVTVTGPTAQDPRATVTVTSPDGTQVRTTTVTVVTPTVTLIGLSGPVDDGERLTRGGILLTTVHGSVPGSRIAVELDGRVLASSVVHRSGVAVTLALVPLRTTYGEHTLTVTADGVPLRSATVTVVPWLSWF